MTLKSTTALSTILGGVLALGLYATPAQAQATRTWVSGVGDDVNPCSRTAPCKTFAGAISKTFINGEIDVLDPGGFGTVTITKSMTLDGTTGSGFGSILASGTTGININIPVGANDPLRIVRLRNLSINGAGASGSVGTRTGIRGIRILNNGAAVVILENVVISDFNTAGISDERTSGKLFIIDGVIRNNLAGAVIGVTAGSSGLTAMLDNVRFPNNVNAGLQANNGAKVTARNSQSYGNQSGFQAINSAVLNLENCAAINNEFGILNGNFGTATTRLSNCVLMNNTTNVQNSGGSVLSFGNNKADTAITVTAASPGQQ